MTDTDLRDQVATLTAEGNELRQRLTQYEQAWHEERATADQLLAERNSAREELARKDEWIKPVQEFLEKFFGPNACNLISDSARLRSQMAGLTAAATRLTALYEATTAQVATLTADLADMRHQRDEAVVLRQQADESRLEIAAERDAAVKERDDNLLIAGDVTCMDIDKPGCGICTLCLQFQRDYAYEETKQAHTGFLRLLHALHLLVEQRAPYDVLDAAVNLNAAQIAKKVQGVVDEFVVLKAERDRAQAALTKINDIRNSLIGMQTINWSEHIYPLVAALDEAGCVGMPYAEAQPYFGSLVDRTVKAEADNAAAVADVAAYKEALAMVRAHLSDKAFKLHRFDCSTRRAPMCSGFGGGDGGNYSCKCGKASVDYVLAFVVSEVALKPKRQEKEGCER